MMMTQDEYWGIFVADSRPNSAIHYLTAVQPSEEEAWEHAHELDEAAFEHAVEEAYGEQKEEPDWDDYDGFHYVEPIDAALAEEAAPQLERNIAIQVYR
jgi:hypothetical protein